MGTDVLIDLLWAGGSVAPAQPTSLRWNWGIFAQTCSTCLDGPYRKDSSSAQPCRATDRAWEPRIPSPCSLKATHATGSKIGSSQSRWNRGTEYYPVGMKTHIEYPHIFFWKYKCPCHIEMGTYFVIDLLRVGGSVAPAQPTSCNTRFIKGHKPSNHIRARIKSHVYTTEGTVYRRTYHVIRYNKASTNVIYYNNDKSPVQSMRKRNT